MKKLIVTTMMMFSFSLFAAYCDPAIEHHDGGSCTVTFPNCNTASGSSVSMYSTSGNHTQCCEGYNDGAGLACPEAGGGLGEEIAHALQGYISNEVERQLKKMSKSK